jgi:hypothetical protein
MKSMKFIVLVLTTLFLFSSCEKLVGEGPVVTESRVTPHFAGVELKIPGHLDYTEGPAYQVELSAQQNILREIETIMTGNDLVIRFKNNHTRIKSHEDIQVRITAPALNKLEVEGSGEIESNKPFNVPKLRMGVHGSGRIRVLKTETTLLDAEISGSGRIDMIEGMADQQKIRVSGSGRVDMGNFIAKQADAEISGSGSIYLNVAETLDARISGSGTIFYRGNPSVTSSVSGSGKVTRL